MDLKFFDSRRLLCIIAFSVSNLLHAQAGPPFLTNDPGTPGAGNWEINVASAQVILRTSATYQVPQIDLNFGIGNRVQLTYEIPYVTQTQDGHPRQSGWSNAFPGIKWRFFDQGDGGWQASVFPQIEANAPGSSQAHGIAAPGSRYLLPLQVTKQAGALELDLEAGYYFPKQGLHEYIGGLVASHAFSGRFDLGLELYGDRVAGVSNRATLDMGGRYEAAPGFIALFMAGRSVTGLAHGPEFIGYFGVQILLPSH